MTRYQKNIIHKILHIWHYVEIPFVIFSIFSLLYWWFLDRSNSMPVEKALKTAIIISLLLFILGCFSFRWFCAVLAPGVTRLGPELTDSQFTLALKESAEEICLVGNSLGNRIPVLEKHFASNDNRNKKLTLVLQNPQMGRPGVQLAQEHLDLVDKLTNCNLVLMTYEVNRNWNLHVFDPLDDTRATIWLEFFEYGSIQLAVEFQPLAGKTSIYNFFKNEYTHVIAKATVRDVRDWCHDLRELIRSNSSSI